MTIFAPGTGATLKSTTVESAFLELVTRLSNATRLTDAPAEATISYQVSSTDKTLVGTAVIPFASGLSSGLVSINPTPFVDQTDYTTGSGGDLSSSGLVDNFVELMYKVNEIPNKPDNTVGGLDLAVDMDTKLITGAFTLPISITVSSAGIHQVEAVDFLV